MADLYMHKLQSVERIDLALFDREIVRPNDVAADLGHNHKSDDFNSFLMHLFFWRLTKQRIANMFEGVAC